MTDKSQSTLTAAFVLALLVATPTFAGDLSKPGDALEVETYRCEVTSTRTIVCKNIGRVCESARALEKETTAHYIGCGLDEWKAAHPLESCPDAAGWHHASSECIPMMIGGL